MRQRWKQAGLIFLSLLAVVTTFAASAIAMVWLRIAPLLTIYVVLAAVSPLAYLAAVRLIERRPAAELSVAPAVRELAGGVLAGIALFALVIAALWIVGAYRPQAWGAPGAAALALVFWLAVGAWEEVLFRGLVYRLCCAIFGTWGAIVLSGVAFGLVHGMEPGATAAALASVALAGLLLGAAYALTGRLWLPIGIHTGWNFAEGSVFGAAVSGKDLSASLIAAKLAGPEVLTGGRFGPEASIITVLVLVVATGYLMWRIARLRRAEPPIWCAGNGSSAAIEA